MVGAFLADNAIGGACRGDRLETLLEFALRVLFLGLGKDPLDQGAEVPEEELSRRIKTAVEIDRPGERLDRVREIRGTTAPAAREFALAEKEMGTEADVVGEETERFARNEPAAALRERPLAFVRKTAEEFLRQDQLDYRVAEVFEALVVRLDAFRLAGQARVGEGLGKEGGIDEAVSDGGLYVIHGRERTRFPDRGARWGG